jgi:hypothetical protein
VIDIDPRLVAAWGEPEATQPQATHRMRLEVDDPVGTWAPLCDALGAHGASSSSLGLPREALPLALSDPVVAPGGLVFRCEGGDADRLTSAWAQALDADGVTRGRLTVNGYPAEREAALSAEVARAGWLVAWLVPRLSAGVDLGYRSLRGWRVRRFPPAHLSRLANLVGARGTAVPVVSAGGTFEIVGHDLASYAGQWLEHGSVTASFPAASPGSISPGRSSDGGSPDGSPAVVSPQASTRLGVGDADAPPVPAASLSQASAGASAGGSPVLVTTVRRGAEMVGVGHVAAGLVDDADCAAALLSGLTDLVVELAEDLAYAVIGVHDPGVHSLRGTPFREQVPATARALHGGLSLSALDQWVLDAAPVQLLSPHHQVTGHDGIELTDIKGTDRRLLRIGEPADWFAGPARRTQVRNRGREALAAGLPPRRTPLPPPLV